MSEGLKLHIHGLFPGPAKREGGVAASRKSIPWRINLGQIRLKSKWRIIDYEGLKNGQAKKFEEKPLKIIKNGQFDIQETAKLSLFTTYYPSALKHPAARETA